jgi:glycosyltransferase involved in cell wall biosynthesis
LRQKIIYCTVTNDLNYDQRMQRICTTLAEKGGYRVVLVGRALPSSKPLAVQPFEQKRLRCWVNKGKFFYLEFNLRLFFFLLFRRFDAVCSVDLDTILAGFYAARLRRRVCVYDAHELFTEVPEVVERPRTQRIWQGIARRTIPRIAHAYTVCQSLADYFLSHYGRHFGVIRNLPFAQPQAEENTNNADTDAPFILLYQGALNDGRGLEELLTALPLLPSRVHLWLAGEGDRSAALRQQAQDLKLGERVKFWGYLPPAQLKALTLDCDAGVNLLQNKGLNYYYSLANKFFDYIQASKPALNMAFPEYERICKDYRVGALLPDLSPNEIQNAILQLLNPDFYAQCQSECRRARLVFTWEAEEQTLLDIWREVVSSR